MKIDNFIFLFDLDGTLIDTDIIYVEVWNQILQKYNIECNNDFFHSFIKGKSDVSFLKFLINNISNDELNNISELKDKLFIEKLENKNILFDGVINFLEKIKNSKIAIVTSCNKEAAKFIINKYKLNNYIDLLISSEDVINHKPHPEPYLKAMNILKAENNKCIIFEDSSAGYLSANKSNPFKTYIYDNKTNNDIVKKSKYNFDDYNNLNINDLLKNDIDENELNFINELKNKLNYLPIKNITAQNDNNLKTGYICDIDKYNINYLDSTNFNIIVKISNLDNELSNTASKLNMYQNEVYFYESISYIINCINIPKFYGSFLYNHKEVIIMEDLNKYKDNFNINLNKNIKILLNVVEKIFNMHNQYYFQNNDEVIKNMKNLKKTNEILYYKELINERFYKFFDKNKYILTDTDKQILLKIYNNFDFILNESSKYPLNFCHGDLKSPNIFYKNNYEPYFLDWQYIHLNKGISDIAFLLVESIDFNFKTVDLVLNYYYLLLKENRREIDYKTFIYDFKISLCIFAFFVMVWFNSEDNEKLIDKCFPLKFMKNLLKYYNYYLLDFDL